VYTAHARRPDTHTLVAQFRNLARDMLGVSLSSLDEINCLVKGLAFLMGYVPAEAYTFNGK